MVDSRPLVTIVLPVFNEEAGIAGHLEEIRRHLDSVPEMRFQILAVNDGSSDSTVEELFRVSHRIKEMSLLSLTRNFGKEAAIQAGLEHAGADTAAVVVMDADLQHPPELLPRMLALWQQGIDVVEAYKVDRGRETLPSRWFARSFYGIFRLLSGMDIQNQSDFKLLDRRVLDAYRSLRERDRFFRGIVHWMGYSSARIPFVVPERTTGTSRWPHLRLFRYSLSAITSFSSTPLHFITVLGIATMALSLAVAAKTLYDKFFGVALGGFTTVILLLLFIGSALMISLGLLGIYVARIHDEIKARPSYLIDWRKTRLSRQDSE